MMSVINDENLTRYIFALSKADPSPQIRIFTLEAVTQNLCNMAAIDDAEKRSQTFADIQEEDKDVENLETRLIRRKLVKTVEGLRQLLQRNPVFVDRLWDLIW